MDEGEGRRTQQRCWDCKALSPTTLTAHTLIGSEHGWRVIRRTNRAGNARYEWRCRECWKKWKESNEPEEG